MIGYLAHRLLHTVLVLWVISVLTFALFWASGAKPAREICNYHCNAQRIAEIEASYGFDKPRIVQYGRYMSGLVNPFGRELGTEGAKVQCGWPCFDRSIHTGRPVWESISDAVGPTFWLATGAAVLWLSGGVLLGIVAALRRGGRLDRLSVGLALLGASVPAMVLGYGLYFVFVVKLQVLPAPDAAGAYTVASGPWFKSYLLPWITLALGYAALYTRLTRASMIDIMSEDFIRTARAKGLPEWRVVSKHGLRAVLAPIVTVFGLDLGGLLGGAVITEQIFSIYGLGRLTLDAVLGIDLSLLMGVVLVTAFFVVTANLVVDVLYAVLDPRVREHQT